MKAQEPKAKTYSLRFDSTIGPIQIFSSQTEIVEIQLESDLKSSASDDKIQNLPEILLKAKTQILDYLAGSLQTLDFPVKVQGTPFDCKVWNSLREIPFGRALTYGEVASLLGNKKLSRAVGGSCKRNRLPLYIPCHRVLGAKSIGGWSQRPGQKEKLLQIENQNFFSEKSYLRPDNFLSERPSL